MARCLTPVQYRHHHTWRWGWGIAGLVGLCLAAGCSGGSGEPGGPGGAIANPPAASISEAPVPEASVPTASVPTADPGATAPDAAADSPPGLPALQTISSPADTLVAAHRLMQAKARRLVVPADPVAVDLYTAKATCEGYAIEPIQVPRQRSMENTVDLILAEQAIPDLTLFGYRTSFDPETKTVTIDLRVARNSRRVLQSLSVCEQKALLGSLRETLLNQPDWQLEAVVFTNRGNPLAL